MNTDAHRIESPEENPEDSPEENPEDSPEENTRTSHVYFSPNDSDSCPVYRSD